MFKFQISNPQVLDNYDSEDTTMGDAIQSIFPLDTEYAFLIWNHICIPLCYKYDLSEIIKDLIRVVSFAKDGNKDHMELHFGSNTFFSTWDLSKEAGKVTIKASWESVLGRLEGLLNEHNELTINIEDMSHEIKRMLTFLKEKLEHVGYNADNLEDFHLLMDL